MPQYPKSVVRPVNKNDLPALMNLAKLAGHGMTNLPYDESALQEKIDTSLHSFSNDADTDLLGYNFVMEDLASGDIIGISGICGAGTHSMPFYHFKMSSVKYVNQDFNLVKDHRILTMVNDYQGWTEICSLFIRPDFRKCYNGALMSRSRFLFMAEYPDRFNNNILAEMRGVVNPDGSQPFWDNVVSHFIDMNYLDADKLTGKGIKQFIPDLMPRYPLYVELLPQAAQDVIDKVHKDTEPALHMLYHEGFASHGYIDIFEAGTMVECELSKINSVRKSKQYAITELIDEKNHKQSEDDLYLISNGKLIDFRVTIAPLIIHHETEEVMLSHEVAKVLQVDVNEKIRFVSLKYNNGKK